MAIRLIPLSMLASLLVGLPALANHDDGFDARIVDCGDVLSEEGSYRLDRHLVCSSDIAVEITASHVHLNLAGFSIRCDRDNPGVGIQVGAVEGVRIRNGTISDCEFGIFLFGTEGSSVRRMHLIGNDVGVPEGDPSGLLLNSAHHNKIIRNVMSGNGHGISLFDSSGNMLFRNDSSDNAFDGLRLLPITPAGGSHDNKIFRNDFNRNDPNLDFFSSGVQWQGPSTGNVFRRNNTNGNGFLGVLVYGATAEGFPVPTGNRITRNTALGNLLFDLAEFDFSTGAPPDECQNRWKRNTFEPEKALGPPGCIK